MKKIISVLVVPLFLGACASTTPQTQITGISIDLPDGDWKQVTHTKAPYTYTKEWVQKGKTARNASWIIREQKIPLQSKMSARQYQQEMFRVAKQSCTDTLFNAPKKIKISGHATSIGSIICAKKNGKPYGSFTDQRVLVQGLTAYIVTSERRMPPSAKAGLFSFTKDQVADMQKFMKRGKQSSSFVRNSVHVCLNQNKKCM